MTLPVDPKQVVPDTPSRRVVAGPVLAALAGIPDRALRAAAKAEAHVIALEGKALTLDVDGVTATFTQPVRLANGVLETRVSMKGLPADANPFQFVNPPILIPDATEKDVYREDPEGAFRAILSDAIRHALTRRRVH